MKQIAVLGLGKFGLSLARTLVKMGHEVLGIDRDEVIVDEVAKELTSALVANVMDEKTLHALELPAFDTVVVSLGDVSSSVIVTMMLREMGVEHIVAKAMDDIHARILNKVGAERIVLPERDMGIRVARSISDHNVLDYIDLSEEYSLVELKALDSWDGMQLRQTDARNKFGLNIVAIRTGNQIQISPDPDYVIHKTDTIVAIGANAQIKKYNDMM